MMNVQDAGGFQTPHAGGDGFVTAELSVRREQGHCRIAWSERSHLTTTVTLAGEGPPATVERSFPVDPEAAGKLQELLATLPGRSVEGGGENALVLSRGGATIASVTWSDAGPAPQVSEATALLERAGHVVVVEAMACLGRGRALREKGAFAEAAAAFRSGIRSLGRDYRDPEGLDHTGTKLVLADSTEREGNLESASYILHGVLESRVAQYHRSHRLPAPEQAVQPSLR